MFFTFQNRAPFVRWGTSYVASIMTLGEQFQQTEAAIFPMLPDEFPRFLRSIHLNAFVDHCKFSVLRPERNFICLALRLVPGKNEFLVHHVL